jgi:hypothetical protein
MQQEVDAASLPSGSEEYPRDRALEALVGVADDQPHAGETAGSERAQEARPEGAVLGVADRETQDLPVTARGDSRGDHDCLGHQLCSLVGLDVGRIEEQIRDADMVDTGLAVREIPSLPISSKLCRRCGAKQPSTHFHAQPRTGSAARRTGIL